MQLMNLQGSRMMDSVFWNDSESNIDHQFSYFSIQNIEYIIDFSADNDILNSLSDLDPKIDEIISGHTTFTVKFAVKEYYENNNRYLFDPPDEHNFGRAEIKKLKETLETLLYKHFLIYQAECYCFVAERDSLNRMYQKMCAKRHLLLKDFKPVYGLGNEQDCFVIKTPLYKEK